MLFNLPIKCDVLYGRHPMLDHIGIIIVLYEKLMFSVSHNNFFVGSNVYSQNWWEHFRIGPLHPELHTCTYIHAHNMHTCM